MKLEIGNYIVDLKADVCSFDIEHADSGVAIRGAGCAYELGSTGMIEPGMLKPEAENHEENRGWIRYGGGGASCILDFDSFEGGVLITQEARTDEALGVMSPLTAEGEGAGIDVGGDLHKWRLMRTGYQSWSPSGSIGVLEAEPFPPLRVFVRNAMHPAYRIRPSAGIHHVDWATVIYNPDNGKCVLIGALSARRYGSTIELEVVGGNRDRLEVRVYNDAEGTPPRPGEVSRTGEKMWVAMGEDPHELWERYLGLVGREMNARTGRYDSMIGWCSWYHYFTKVAERDIRQNLDVISNKAGEHDIELVQLDDGYCKPGDWFDWNDKFPSGPGELARSISARGYRPGIWISPFSCTRASRLYKERPDMLLKDAGGKPMLAGLNPMWTGVSFHPLDLTNPSTLSYVRKTAEAVREWGYRFLKIDFVYASLLRGKRHDPYSTGVEAYRMGLETIREAIGEDVFLLGCGAPLLPSVGYVDGMRVSADVAPKWREKALRIVVRAPFEPSCENAIHGTVCRAAMHRRLWLNDPDCLMVRKTRSKLSIEEVQTLTTVIFLSSGMMLFSDNMAELDAGRWKMARATMPFLHDAARAVDLFESDNPVVYALDGEDGRRLVALINWSDRSAYVETSLNALGLEKPCHGFEYWGRRYLGLLSDRVGPFFLPPHGCVFLSLVPADDKYRVLSTTYHMGQGAIGAKCEPSGEGLSLELELPGPRNGRVYIVGPGLDKPRELDVSFVDSGKADISLD